jgi:hypothetical protein
MKRTFTPVAFVVSRPDSDILKDDEWVVGVVVGNPFTTDEASGQTELRSWMPDMLRPSGYLICSLRSWHPVSDLKVSYKLWEIESAWTSNALVTHLIADWPYERGQERPPVLIPDVALDVDDKVDLTPYAKLDRRRRRGTGS